ncbi:hypothetical protein SERLA73DRAFT_82989 [Serpula lacrymans var. lacrymans S7.3]|uniref:Uncharacterized protein n=2 Tax=Serpula lacrymans var. lacrymans TaxID=341189 RepID=F8PG27_SERL3|nr:uncharacterized protein SERLADRAFT_359232 [Serpula lacrymans var. lacrymans S7.9]EGO05362.1 hypothetical protein SERLA73DRAFT_82989 [Serpula lacrymans var. lacrymans S7.3]EGO31212.1 hypothetical protein SERLADRAFT_359232 [Serpula lacrymans var. lacrymans S7.9]
MFPTLWLALQCLFGLLAVLLSSFIYAQYHGYIIRIKKIRPFLISGLFFSYKSQYSISASHLRLRFYFPRPTSPRWVTFEVFDYEYKDLKCHVSIALLEVTIWFMPVYFRFSGGAWLLADLNDFRLRVFSSSETPFWIQRMRKNLVTTVLTGEILRVDDFQTKLSLGTLSGAPDGYSGPIERNKGTSKNEEYDEIRLTTFVDNYHVKNFQERLYTFTGIQAQFRRSWVDDRGSYVLIAEGARWTKVQSLNERRQSTITSDWGRMFSSITSFPSDVLRIFMDPMSSIDIYCPRADITFDYFRIRDAELLRQGFVLFNEKLEYSGVNITNVPGMLVDALTALWSVK